MKKCSRTSKNILALCLCLALLAGTACAEEIHVLSSGNSWDNLSCRCTLPDGRILLAGEKQTEDPNYIRQVWLLCLNPDRTVSWEAADDLYDEVRTAAVLPDGTIGAVFENRQMGDKNRPDQVTVKFFTQDGQPTGKSFDLPPECAVAGACPSWMMAYRWKENTQTDETETVLFSWDGDILLRYDGLMMPGAYGEPIDYSDELVFAGQDTSENGHAKILKLDGLTDRILWETTLNWRLPDTDDARFLNGIRTEDGGYAVLLQDGNFETPGGFTVWRDFLVKFDAEGRMQWIHRESFEKDDLYVFWVFPGSNGKIGVYCEPESDNLFESFVPLTFFWFDQDGKQLGTTEWLPEPDEFPVMKKYLEPDGSGNERVPSLSLHKPVRMEDGLWAPADCHAVEWEDGEFMGICDGSQELVLVRIPEPGE